MRVIHFSRAQLTSNSHLFEVLDENKAVKNVVCCSFLEIYKEKIHDLLHPTEDNLRIRQTTDKGIFVEGAQDVVRIC